MHGISSTMPVNVGVGEPESFREQERTYMMPFLRRQWFLLTLVAVLALGFGAPRAFETFANASTLRSGIVATVLFIMALPLDTQSITRSIRRPGAALLASSINMLLLPCLAWACSRPLSGDMRTGLLVAAAVPCTLASAAVWTRRAGGDDTVAILVTALTNLTCFLTTPFLLYLTTGSELTEAHHAQLARMPGRLMLLVVLPMGSAQLLRWHKPIACWADTHKTQLGVATQLGILSMVLAGSAFSGLKLADTSWSELGSLPAMFGLALVLHLGVLWMGFQLAKLCGMQRPRQVAVAISGSQKTLMVGLDIAIFYFGGLAILPMVTYHFIQLVVDTIVADRFRADMERGPIHE